MNMYKQYADVYKKLEQLSELQKELREQIVKEVSKTEKGINTPYGSFQKVITKKWAYSNYLLKQQGDYENKIKQLKDAIKTLQLKAQVTGRANYEEEVNFRYIQEA